MSLARMFAEGFRKVVRHRRLVMGLYLIQLVAATLFFFAAWMTLSAQFADRPLFDRAATGDVVALVDALSAAPAATTALMWSGVAMALAYAVLSWYLTAGLLGALRGDGFAATAGRRLFGFARLWAWSLIPYAVALVVLAIGQIGAAANREGAMKLSSYLLGNLLWSLPGLLLFAITSCAVDYARVAMVKDHALGAGRALLRAFRLLSTRKAPLLHYGLYLLFWIAVGAVYLAITAGNLYAGAGGALLLFALRQLVLAGRFLARVTTYAGQSVLIEAEGA